MVVEADGDGHKISHPTIKGRGYLGVFGYSSGAVITDLRFSGPSGTEGLDVVRATRVHHPAAAVVLMTGCGSLEAEKEARRLGVAFVPKPVPLWELARLVQGWAIA